MNILLINENPVVNKLVTLSAQKTSDALDVVTNMDDIESPAKYNLLIVDDQSYQDGMLDDIQEKISFATSLLVKARDADDIDGFDAVIKKPFLPTDLVDTLVRLQKDLPDDSQSVATSESSDEISFDELDSIDDIDNLDSLDSLGALDDDLSDLDGLDDLEELGESVLDGDEAQKVKDLAVKTREYTDKEGNRKANWQNIGVVMQNDDGGEFIILDRWVNLAGIPDFKNPNSTSVMVSVSIFKDATSSTYCAEKANCSISCAVSILSILCDSLEPSL